MTRFNRIVFGTLLVTLTLGTALAQNTFDGRAAGMAFSNSADTRGLEQVGLNPATLALKHRVGFELNLLAANLSVATNGLNKGLYDRYFTTGDTLRDAEKQDILGSIPGSGLRGELDARLNTFAFYLPNFSVAVTGVSRGTLNLPREVAELALYGNADLGRVYDFQNTDGNAWGGLVTRVGFAVPRRFSGEGLFDMMAVGVTGKYIAGMAYFEVEEAHGTFTNVDSDHLFMEVDGQIEARSATGGTGFGFDLGVVAEKSDRFTVSLAVLNAFSSMTWDGEPEAMTYSVTGDRITVGSGDSMDSLLVETDTTIAIGAFQTRLPVTVDLGLAYRPWRPFVLTASFEKGFQEDMGGTTASRFSLGMEGRWLPFLPLRAGMSVGGRYGTSVALGTGLNLRILYVDAGVISHGGFRSSDSRGLTLAATARLSF